ncbi:MAG: phosphate ABC transporter permease PstA [Verrucomicrobiae bacterium]|nr:phosphate ABC transporter permease PstA [Verrucomicrobiae bacterium]
MLNPLAAAPRRARRLDRAIAIAGGAASFSTLAVFGWIVWDLIRLGLPNLSWHFLTGEVETAGRSGGIGPVLVSTLLILLCCLAVAVPLGIGCAVWLSEFVRRGSRASRIVTGGVDLLASVPSIVFGLFGMTFFCQVLGLGFSILSGGLTLACMILPILVRTTLLALEGLPADLRPGAAALGLTRTTTLRQVLLPTALPGILVAITLGVGRALSETAALLFTSGYSTRWPDSLGESGRALSVHIYDLAMNIPNGSPNASASALVLLVLILLINLTATGLTERWTRHLSGTTS